MARGGISRVFADLIEGLPQSDLDVSLLFRLHGNAHLRATGLIRLPSPLFRLSARLGHALRFRLPAIGGVEGEHSDGRLLHATYYLDQPRRGLSGPLVSTLHDMTPELYPELAPLGRGGHRVHKLRWFEASDAIVSVSASSAADLTGMAPHLASRIQVIHHGTGFQELRPRPCRLALRRPFHLIVGRRGGYKNVACLLEPLGLLSQHLVLAGGGPLLDEERQLLRHSGLRGRVHVVHPDDAQLAWLYRHCRAVLLPSLAEGFSLPLIEALACDAPVLASDLPVHREIGAGYVELLDPSDPAAWRRALADGRPLHRPSQRLSPERLAALRRHFSHERMLADYRRFYRSLV